MTRVQQQASLDLGGHLFKLSEVARLLDIHIQTLHYWVKTGRVRSLQRTSAGGSYLVPRKELVRLLADAGREVPGLWERKRLKVLLIEDDAGIRRFALAAARSPHLPLVLKAAPSVEEGLLLAAQFKPGVILIDTSFPEGKLRTDQALAFIRGTKLLKNTRVVTLVTRRKAGAAMLRCGADAFLLKPFGLSEFREAIAPQQARRKAVRSVP